MVELTARARWFAKGAARGTGGTGASLFEDRSGSRTMLGQRSFAPGKSTGSTYLRNGLLVLGVVAAGLLLGRRSTQEGVSPSTFSDTEGMGGADAPERPLPEPAGPPKPAQGPAEDLNVEIPAPSRSAPQEAVTPAPLSSAETPPPEDPSDRSDGDLDEVPPVESVPSGESPVTPSGEEAAIEESVAEGAPATQEAEPPVEEMPNIIEELPPPPPAPEVELPPPPSSEAEELPPPASAGEAEEELPPPPPTEDAASIAEELPPPPEVEEVELPPPPAASENVIDELPPPPVPEEQDVGELPTAEAEAPAEPVAQAPQPSVEPVAEVPQPTAEPVDEAPRAEEPRGRRRVTATPSARRLAKELGVDLLSIEGTGKNGRITVDDVRNKGGQAPS